MLDDAAGDGCIGVGLNLFGSSEGLDQIGAAGHAYQEREICNCGRAVRAPDGCWARWGRSLVHCV